MSSRRNLPEIRVATAADRAAVMGLALDGQGDELRQRLLEQANLDSQGDESRCGALLAAYVEDRLVGAVWGQWMPGRAALVWPPRLSDDAPQGTDLELLAEVKRQLAVNRVRLIQVVVKPDAVRDAALLRRANYAFAAELFYLVSLVDSLVEPRRPTPLTFRAFDELQLDRLASLVELTYENSQDCPLLNGKRDIYDVLEGYRQTGQFHPEQWLFVDVDGQDVGCLLLADHPQDDQWELVYMGLVPGARGRGWGSAITRHAQRLTREAGRPRLALAVDAANRPALSTYAAAGFQIWDRRHVWITTI